MKLAESAKLLQIFYGKNMSHHNSVAALTELLD